MLYVCPSSLLGAFIDLQQEDVRRQALNVFRIKLLGAQVVAVEAGTRTLRDAVNEVFSYRIAIYCHIALADLIPGTTSMGGQPLDNALHHRIGHRSASVPDHRADHAIRHR